MKISCLTTVWGSYVGTFLKGTVKSLSFPENRKAMDGVIWNIFTEEDDFERIEGEISRLIPGAAVRVKSLAVIRDRIDYLHSALIWQIRECLKGDSRMLLLPPDSIFGDGTLKSLFTLGKETGSCVLVPHPRALPSILNEPYESNADLVSASWKHLHRSWTDSEVGNERQNSFIGGVAWERLNEKTVSVKHLLPTPYFCDFTGDDLNFFETQLGIGSIDHVWPSMLIQQGRARYVGSSDACFIVELTDADKNLPPAPAGQDQTKFWKNHPHNIFNHQVRCIFRSN